MICLRRPKFTSGSVLTPDKTDFSNSDTTSCSGINQRIIHFPYLHVSASEEGDGHGVAAAAAGAGHGLGVCRGGKLYVKRLEGVAAVVTFEFCFSSYHSILVCDYFIGKIICIFPAAKIRLLAEVNKFIMVHKQKKTKHQKCRTACLRHISLSSRTVDKGMFSASLMFSLCEF